MTSSASSWQHVFFVCCIIPSRFETQHFISSRRKCFCTRHQHGYISVLRCDFCESRHRTSCRFYHSVLSLSSVTIAINPDASIALLNFYISFWFNRCAIYTLPTTTFINYNKPTFIFSTHPWALPYPSLCFICMSLLRALSSFRDGRLAPSTRAFPPSP